MQVSEQIELKPCPFCGGGDCNTEGRTYSNKGQMFCHDCGASGPHPIYEVATWTSRAALAAAQPVVKPLAFDENRNGYWTAEFGYQIANTKDDLFRVRLNGGVVCNYIKGFTRAVKWANKHHEERILSALSLPTQEPKSE